MKNLVGIMLISLTLASCGEEVLTQNTLSVDYSANKTQSFELNTCSQMHFEKPPVDILFVVDNSGSSLLPSFQQIKQQLANTLYTISNEFDYHIYIAPLMPKAGDSLSQYPILASDQSSFNTSALNFVQLKDLNMFESAAGNNVEYGFQRALDLINANRAQTTGIFRDHANTIVVMISNGDDTQAVTTIGGNQIVDQQAYTSIKENFLKYTEKYAQSHSVNTPMNAESFRFLSLVAHSNCTTGWKRGSQYISLSHDVYDYMGYSDNAQYKDSLDLCGGNYSALFSAINESIHAVIVGHKYDHWKISSANEAQIQSDDITVHKIVDGQKIKIDADSSNGFEYIGHKNNYNTRYAVMRDTNDDGIPEEVADPGEPQTGLMIKLNGDARIEYPQCIIAKTKTPTEYFGYVALPREPQISTITVSINGQNYSQSSTNGWSYIGWLENKNIKVPGSSNAAIVPAVNKSGYFIQLHGTAILTNGDEVSVHYKPASL